MEKGHVEVVTQQLKHTVVDIFDQPQQTADELARWALVDNQWAEILTMAAERLHDGDWRAAQVVETF